MVEIWNLLILNPMINLLLVLYNFLISNFGLAIVAMTIIVRLIMQPLMSTQMRSMKAMQELQPELQALQKKYGKDRERMAQEQMKIYREKGINPFGGCLPMIIQMPVWIALYQAIIQVLGSTPEQLMQLSQHIYEPLAAMVERAIPLNSQFLWLNLALPDPYYVLPVLVVFVFWLQQKMSSVPTTDPQSASMNQSMQIMMPIMFGFFTLSVASGLALYWVVSGLIGIITQYRIAGWGGLRPQAAGGTDGKQRTPAKRGK